MARRLTIGTDRDSIGCRIHPFDLLLSGTTGGFTARQMRLAALRTLSSLPRAGIYRWRL